jgi:hypothetical protein
MLVRPTLGLSLVLALALHPAAALACAKTAPTMEEGASISVGRMADLVWPLREVDGALVVGVEAWL